MKAMKAKGEQSQKDKVNVGGSGKQSQKEYQTREIRKATNGPGDARESKCVQ
jgi:hypothetical protein